MAECSVVWDRNGVKIIKDDFLAGYRSNGVAYNSVEEASWYMKNILGVSNVPIVDNERHYIGHT